MIIVLLRYVFIDTNFRIAKIFFIKIKYNTVVKMYERPWILNVGAQKPNKLIINK